MDITQLRYFMALANRMNYTRAAEDLFLSRQALRQSIQSLENDLGSPLFQNQSNRLYLTPAGLALKEKAPKILEAFDTLPFEVREQSSSQHDISLAYSESLCLFLLPDLSDRIAGFQNEHPTIPIHARALSNDLIFQALQEESCHFGLMMVMPWDSPDYQFAILQDFSLGIMMSSDDAMASRASLQLSDLAGRKLVGMGALDSSFHPLKEALEAKHIPVSYQSVPDPIDAFYHAKHGTAFCFNVAEAQNEAMTEICIRPLPLYRWPMCLVYRQDHLPAPQEECFIRHLKHDLEVHPVHF